MDYIIHEDTLPDGYGFISESECCKYEVQLEGAEFVVDNKKVWQILKKLVLGTNALRDLMRPKVEGELGMPYAHTTTARVRQKWSRPLRSEILTS